VAANTAYDEARYGRAVEAYSELLEHGVDDGRVHFNLGNAYLRNGELGQAIASYLRARARLPRNQDVVANLDFARKSTKDALAPPAPSPVMSTLFFWHYGFSSAELRRAAVALNLVFWLVLAAGLYRRSSEVLRWMALAALVLLLAVGGSLVARWAFPQRVAVVIPQEIEARSGNSSEDVVRFKLHAGTEVRVVERRGDWFRIALPDGQQGWVPGEQVEVVRR
jgi:tetratricopeptide (TPR) repeat protein